jgi:mono/diheme cytochrome c family protein
MKFKLLTLLTAIALTFSSCGDGKKSDKPAPKQNEVKKTEPKKAETTSTKMDLTAPTLDNKGIGPVKDVKLGAIDNKMAEEGKALYKTNCTACHKFKKRYIGPGLKGITERRSPEWIMNMILNTDEMLKKDPIAKALIAEYNAPMAKQQISEKEARAILEYFRTKK